MILFLKIYLVVVLISLAFVIICLKNAPVIDEDPLPGDISLELKDVNHRE